MTATERRSVPRPGCEPCWGLWHRWLDYKPPPAPIVLCSPNRTVREIRDSQRRRADDTYELIRTQQAMIAAQCWSGNHYPTREERDDR